MIVDVGFNKHNHLRLATFILKMNTSSKKVAPMKVLNINND